MSTEPCVSSRWKLGQLHDMSANVVKEHVTSNFAGLKAVGVASVDVAYVTDVFVVFY